MLCLTLSISQFPERSKLVKSTVTLMAKVYYQFLSENLRIIAVYHRNEFPSYVALSRNKQLVG